MDAAIAASAFVLGLAGAPHCTAMCAAPCAAAVGRSRTPMALLAFHAARVLGYALAGAMAAGGVAGLSALAQLAPVLRPLWALVHAAFFVLGLWLLWQGRQPQLLALPGRRGVPTLAAVGWPAPAVPTVPATRASTPRGRSRTALRAGLAGGLWFALPCGLLQSALLVAALANTSAGGAMAMAAFASASSSGLLLAPAIWRRLGRSGGGEAERWALRAAGLLIVVMSGWALTQGLWHRVAAYCATL